MSNSKENQNLHKRLTGFFSGSDTQVDNALCDMVLSSMMDNVDFDATKFASALDVLATMKTGNISGDFRGADNVFDISSRTSNTFVKGFMSKGMPILYFYRQNESLPFFKLKSSKNKFGDKLIKIEAASSGTILSSHKLGSSADNMYYLKTVDITKTDDGLTYDATTKAVTGGDDTLFVSKQNFNDEYKLFYNFLQNALLKNKIKLGDSISSAKYDFIFLEMYNKIKKSLEEVEDFTMSDIVVMMDAIINNTPVGSVEILQDGTAVGNHNSKIASEITFDKYDANDRRRTYSAKNATTGESYDAFAVKADNYLSIDLSKDGKLYSSYMMGKTNEGFTLFKLNKNKDKSKNNDFVMLTFNLTNNIFRFSASYDELKIGNAKEDVIITIMDNGEMILDSISLRGKTKKAAEYAAQAAL